MFSFSFPILNRKWNFSLKTSSNIARSDRIFTKLKRAISRGLENTVGKRKKKHYKIKRIVESYKVTKFIICTIIKDLQNHLWNSISFVLLKFYHGTYLRRCWERSHQFHLKKNFKSRSDIAYRFHYIFINFILFSKVSVRSLYIKICMYF